MCKTDKIDPKFCTKAKMLFAVLSKNDANENANRLVGSAFVLFSKNVWSFFSNHEKHTVRIYQLGCKANETPQNAS